ncbi:MAG: sigma-70 family RNA polymerase sigma factor [Vicinamibacterales bacterium]|nr:sigma-70 family RNA polymerase sigma factor [Vicinamibacterales bacterium]
MTELMDPLSDPARELRREFDERIAPHREGLWRYCLKLTGNPWDAEDLVQETLLKAFGRLSFYWQPLNLRAYLFRMASNAWIDAWRRVRPTEPLDTHEPATLDTAGDDAFAARDALRVVVDALPPRQRVVFLLTEAFDFAAADVAGMLGMSEGAVKAARQRARVTLAARASEGDTRAGARREPDPVVERYLDAFNRRDVEALTALFAEDAVNEIVGSADEIGVEVMRRNSLAEWLAEPHPHRAERHEVFGREVLLVFEDNGLEEALVWMVAPRVEEGVIRAQRIYCFNPELLTAVAAEVGVPVRTRGHWYGQP